MKKYPKVNEQKIYKNPKNEEIKEKASKNKGKYNKRYWNNFIKEEKIELMHNLKKGKNINLEDFNKKEKLKEINNQKKLITTYIITN